MMTSSNLNIVLTNALCSISKKAIEVNNLFIMGNSCAYSELIKLKLTIDAIHILECYNSELESHCLTEEQATKLINNLMALTDICECQLTQ